VLKVEEDFAKRWVDSRLTVACKYGFTLLYDEFTRSRAEANNVLLSVLQEKILDIPAGRTGEDGYLKVHPNFVGIFTSNPEEYAGVHKAADALRDRMITLDLSYPDFETEVAIVVAKSKIPLQDAEEIVSLVRALRESGRCEFAPTVRAAIMIAKTLAVQRTKIYQPPDFFMNVCQDVLVSETSRVGSRTNQEEIRALVKKLVERTRLYMESSLNGKVGLGRNAETNLHVLRSEKLAK
jgi:gas vesicle protein GvpN